MSEGTEDVVSTAYQQPCEHLITFLGDAFLTGIPVSRLIFGRHESQISTHAAALFEAVGIFDGEHEGKRRKRPHSLDLPQELRFWVGFSRDRFQLVIVFADALCQRTDLLEDGP